MTDLRIAHTEYMVGAGHPTASDTLNRLALAEHDSDGTHRQSNIYSDLKSKGPWADVRAFGAIGDGIADDTAAIQSAINSEKKVYIPSGVYLVDPSISLLLDFNGITVCGDGMDKSILYCKNTGGSVFKRTFNPAGANPYVINVLVMDIGIVFNHPVTADPGNYVHYGFDFRNITRSKIVRCYAGNYNRGAMRTNGLHAEPNSHANAIQGYGVVFGNVSSSDPAYAGGEVNQVFNSQIWGTKKAIVSDDANLSPLSAAHACVIEGNDVQICESGIAIESRYTAGSVIRDNTVQAVKNATGSAATTYVYRIDGYSCYLGGGYTEAATPDADHLVFLGSLSKRNIVMPFQHGTSAAPFTDNGTGNVIASVNSSTNIASEKFNKVDLFPGRAKAWVTFDGAGTILKSHNVAGVIKNSTGDFTINFSAGALSDANFSFSGNGIVNASANPGCVVGRTQTASSLRIITFNLNAGAVAADFNVTSITVWD